jgi:hypothetical protein
MGQDVEELVAWALAMLAAAELGSGGAAENPAVGLGLAIGAAARSGRDKLTLVLPRGLEAFGLWVEQLIAESTGKNGTGVVPIAGETLARPAAYGDDRFFVVLRSAGEATAQPPAGGPVAEIDFPEPSALAAEFVRWEVATAIAGALLAINPFDEPNVQQAKDATRALLEKYKADRELPKADADRALSDGVSITLSREAQSELHGRDPDAFLSLVRPGDYVALLAYVGPEPAMADELRALRLRVRDATRAATMFGYGPRYLHSTGQLHKGGPNTGVFMLITAQPSADIAIPGEVFSFGTLELAQALGDFASLDASGRRAMHVHLPAPDPTLVKRLADTLLTVR